MDTDLSFFITVLTHVYAISPVGPPPGEGVVSWQKADFLILK